MSGFAVACGHQVTADAAAEILRSGGTAVDAAIAAALTAMVAEPVLAGLLGGGFLMIREPSGQARLLDFFVQTPSRVLPDNDVSMDAITADFGTTTQDFHIGPGTVAVPGMAPGLWEAHARFGHLPMTEIAAPSMTAARQGVQLTGYQARLAQIVAPILTATDGAKALHCADETLLSEGALYRNADFAAVIEEYAHEGPRFVTEGEIAKALLTLQDTGGQVTTDDLRSYTPLWRDPLQRQRGGARVRLNPPPSMGGTLIAFGLDILPDQPTLGDIVRTLEATAQARLDTDIMRDPAGGAARLHAPDLVEAYHARVRTHRAATRGTTHISIIDGDGQGAALTLSNGEGCGHVLPGTGIMPNNMLGEDDLLPDGLQSWTPGRRLSSMMAPLVVDWPDGRFAMVGSGGSNRIRTALVQVLSGLIDQNAHLVDAIDAPRAHVEIAPDEDGRLATHIDFEDLGDPEARDLITQAWPQARLWSERSMFFGGVHAAIAGPSGRRDAAGDPRRAGVSVLG
ncbi:MAG: gamma-glutamyltransferase [Pseudomonadota bacterium]